MRFHADTSGPVEFVFEEGAEQRIADAALLLGFLETTQRTPPGTMLVFNSMTINVLREAAKHELIALTIQDVKEPLEPIAKEVA